MSNLVNQSYLRGTKPVIFNVQNFTKPAAGQPLLISYDDVTTMFHEFGHALHGMFAAQTYPSLSGTCVARDFVEFPSQFNENWALDPKVLAHYAVNYQTGQPMPQALVDKIKRSRTFNQGYDLGETLEAARLDLDWHSLPARRASAGRRPVRGQGAGERRVRHRRRTAALPQQLFLAHLEQRLCRRLLCLPVDADACAGRVQLVRDAWRAHPRQRPALPRHGPVARQHARLWPRCTGRSPGMIPDVRPMLEFYGLPVDASQSTTVTPMPIWPRHRTGAAAPKKGERG